MTEAETAQKMADELRELAKSPELVLSISPMDAFALLACLQLAWRHPRLNPNQKKLIEGFGRALQDAFADAPLPFAAVRVGLKRHEVRVNDRGFQVGDWINLHEWDQETETYSGETVHARVTFITEGGTYGLPAHLCVLSIDSVHDGARNLAEPGHHE